MMSNRERSEERQLSLDELSVLLSKQGFGVVSSDDLRTELGIEGNSLCFLDLLTKLIADEKRSEA